jgi:hypothetical protein
MVHCLYPALVLFFPAILLLASAPVSAQQSCENPVSLLEDQLFPYSR